MALRTMVSPMPVPSYLVVGFKRPKREKIPSCLAAAIPMPLSSNQIARRPDRFAANFYFRGDPRQDEFHGIGEQKLFTTWMSETS